MPEVFQRERNSNDDHSNEIRRNKKKRDRDTGGTRIEKKQQNE